MDRIYGADGLQADVRQEPAGHVKVVISKAGRQLTWQDVIKGLSVGPSSLRTLLSQTLQRLQFDAFFWECPPVSNATRATRLFEFVAIPAPSLAAKKADQGAFAEHLDRYQGQPVSKAFPNLGGDTILIAPAAADSNVQVYAHIASFFRRAPPQQLDQQWLTLAKALDERLRNSDPHTNVWVSTSGLGVYWLHMRLDSRPKYYNHKAYKDPSHGLCNGSIGESISVAKSQVPQPYGVRTCAHGISRVQPVSVTRPQAADPHGTMMQNQSGNRQREGQQGRMPAGRGYSPHRGQPRPHRDCTRDCTCAMM